MATALAQLEEIDHIAEKVANWPNDARLRLINRITRTDAQDADTDISDEWLATIDRRAEEMRNGTAVTYTFEETKARVRKAIGL